MLFVATTVEQPSRTGLFPKPFHRHKTDINGKKVALPYVLAQASDLPSSVEFLRFTPVGIAAEQDSPVEYNR